MKKISQEQGLTLEEIKSILCEVKKGDITRVTFKNEQLRRFFPRNYTNDQIKQAILETGAFTAEAGAFTAEAGNRVSPQGTGESPAEKIKPVSS